jgi:hypothetical protein
MPTLVSSGSLMHKYGFQVLTVGAPLHLKHYFRSDGGALCCALGHRYLLHAYRQRRREECTMHSKSSISSNGTSLEHF